MNNLRWKFINGDKSRNVNHEWEIGKWYAIDDSQTLDLWRVGFHCSDKIVDALGYVASTTLALVQCKGEHIVGDDGTKECWREMRVVEIYEIPIEKIIKLAVFSADLILDNYEKIYPGDDRPAKAIKAAKAYLNNPCKETVDAVAIAAMYAESAAWDATVAASQAADMCAAWDAATAAAIAARSAECVAESAKCVAESVRLVAIAVRLVAESADYSKSFTEAKNKIERWCIENFTKEATNEK